jgi:choline-sulfatase
VHAPGRFPARRVAAAVSLADLLPTLLDLGTDAAEPSLATPVDGRSLYPHLTGGEGPDEAVGEYLAEGAVAPIVMIRRGRWKFVHCPQDPDELYDLLVDPEERANLASNPEQTDRVQAFRNEVARRWNLAAVDVAVRESQKRRHLVAGTLSIGTPAPWDYQPRRDASREYVRNTMALDDIEAQARFPRVRRPATVTP